MEILYLSSPWQCVVKSKNSILPAYRNYFARDNKTSATTYAFSNYIVAQVGSNNNIYTTTLCGPLFAVYAANSIETLIIEIANFVFKPCSSSLNNECPDNSLEIIKFFDFSLKISFPYFLVIRKIFLRKDISLRVETLVVVIMIVMMKVLLVMLMVIMMIIT